MLKPRKRTVCEAESAYFSFVPVRNALSPETLFFSFRT